MIPAPAARADIDRLIALGRRKGELTLADLQVHLPIAALSAEEIARAVIAIEEAGVPVDLEEVLEAPASGRAYPADIASVPIAPGLPAPEIRAPEIRAPEPRDGPGAGATPVPASGPAQAPPAERRRVSQAVLIAGIAVLLILGFALVLAGR